MTERDSQPLGPAPAPDADSALPESLRQELRSLYRPPTPFPAGQDAAILAAARQASRTALAGRAGGRWRWAAGTGLAAAVALAATLYWATPRRDAAADVYVRTGDIRDSYYLARQLKQTSDGKSGVAGTGAQAALEGPKEGKAGAPAWDVNGDSRVDEGDVRALALAAVHLEPAKPGGVR